MTMTPSLNRSAPLSISDVRVAADGVSALETLGRRLARADSWPAVMAVTRNAKSATQFSGSAMWKVPTGGRKKKLKQATASRDANIAGLDPQAVARKSTISSSDNATVVGLT